MQTARKASDSHRESRRKLMAAINIRWKELRPDLHGDAEALRAERLAYVGQVLKLKQPLSSMTELTNYHLNRVLFHFDELQRQPALPGTMVVAAKPAERAEIIHLASREQVFAINKLLDFLGWQAESRKKFLSARFKRENPVHLLPRQAQSLIRILLNIACSQELKARGFRKVTRPMIATHIPALKKKLGIDRKEAHTSEGTDGCQEPLLTSTTSSES